MPGKKTLLLISTLLAGCTSEHTNTVSYNPQTIKEGGIEEMRAFISGDPCPAALDEDRGSPEAAALLLAVATPILSETLKYGFSLISKVGSNMAKPYPLNAYIYPSRTTLISNAQCLTLVYGQFGGTGKNNLTTPGLPYQYYNTPLLAGQLTSDLGFAMQIKIQRSEERLSFVPYSLFYPKQLRPYGMNNHHGLTVAIDFGGNDATIEFDKVYVGRYYNQQAVITHGKTIELAKVTPYTLKITVTEGPDNETLAGLLQAVSSSDVVAAQQQILKTYIDKKIAEKTAK